MTDFGADVGMAYMTTGAYAEILRYCGGGRLVGLPKYPRKLKKRYFGTKSQWRRRSKQTWDIGFKAVDVRVRLEEIRGPHV